MSFLESIVEKALTTVGVDEQLAEQIGDLASAGANLAMQNHAGAAADALDLAELDDDVPWLAQGLEIAGGDPMAAELSVGEIGGRVGSEIAQELCIQFELKV